MLQSTEATIEAVVAAAWSLLLILNQAVEVQETETESCRTVKVTVKDRTFQVYYNPLQDLPVIRISQPEKPDRSFRRKGGFPRSPGLLDHTVIRVPILFFTISL